MVFKGCVFNNKYKMKKVKYYGHFVFVNNIWKKWINSNFNSKDLKFCVYYINTYPIIIVDLLRNWYFTATK